MKFLEKHPLIMIVIGIAGISLSAIFVKYSQAPSVVTAFYRLMWTVVLMTPVVFGRGESRRELMGTDRKSVLLCALSGLFLAMHFTTWFESLNKTSVASSTAIVCTEVIWVAIGYCLFLKGRISLAAAGSIFVTVGGSLLIAFSDYSAGGNHLLGDMLALAAAVFCAVYTLSLIHIWYPVPVLQANPQTAGKCPGCMGCGLVPYPGHPAPGFPGP